MVAKTSSRGISWLISAAEMIFLLCGAQARMDRGGSWWWGGQIWAGLGWQTKGAARRRGEGTSAFTQAGGYERGGDRKVRG